jgi:hypothetical protein
MDLTTSRVLQHFIKQKMINIHFKQHTFTTLLTHII